MVNRFISMSPFVVYGYKPRKLIDLSMSSRWGVRASWVFYTEFIYILRSQNKLKQVMSNTNFKLIYINIIIHLIMEIMSWYGLDLNDILLEPIKNCKNVMLDHSKCFKGLDWMLMSLIYPQNLISAPFLI